MDPILPAGIGLLIVRGAWRLLREAVDALVEATPGSLDVADVQGLASPFMATLQGASVR